MFDSCTELNGQSIIRTLTIDDLEFESIIENRADSGLTPESSWWQSFLRGADCLSVQDQTRKLRIVDAFCGCGGLGMGVSLAAAALGYHAEFAAVIDSDVLALEVNKANLGSNNIIHAGVSSLVDYHISGQGTDVKFGYRPEPISRSVDRLGLIDLFLAGPPCQGHSNLNNHTRREDPRNHLYLTAVALGVAIGSSAIIIENVPTVRHDRSNVVAKAVNLLSSSGYSVATSVLRADELGAAQRRARFFMIAVRDTNSFDDQSLIEMTSELTAPASPVSWAIGDLLDCPPNNLMDTPAALTEINRSRLDYLFDNELYDLPDHQRPDCHKDGHSYRSVYGRMYWDRPAQTITTGFNTAGRGRYIHPLRRRVITPHEAARLQGFPDSYSFMPPTLGVSRSNLAKWIGDAVHPILGYASGLTAMAALVRTGHLSMAGSTDVCSL